MGCDIHLHTEIKVNGKWEHMGNPSVPRNYRLFTKMAGVREVEGVKPIDKPRGLPDDVSVVTALDYQEWDLDAHSASWLGASELEELTEFYESIKRSGDPNGIFFAESVWGYCFGNSWGGFFKYPGDNPEFLEDVRLFSGSTAEVQPMKDPRKDLRIRLPDQHRQAFSTAKAKAERELGYTLRDNEFATRVLVQAVRQWEPVQDAKPRAHLPENCRERLRLEGRAYPKSGCSSCGNGGMKGCPHKID